MRPLSEMSTAGPGDVSGCEGVVMAIDPPAPPPLSLA